MYHPLFYEFRVSTFDYKKKTINSNLKIEKRHPSLNIYNIKYDGVIFNLLFIYGFTNRHFQTFKTPVHIIYIIV